MEENMNGRLTITDVSKALGITTRTIMRWEKSARIKRAKRDWRGWRFYHKEDLEEIRKFYESTYDYETLEASGAGVAKNILIVLLALTCLFSTYIIGSPAYSDAALDKTPGVRETRKAVDIVLDKLPVVEPPTGAVTESVKYTLGPDDVISIEVRRHPEFGGEYTVNSEGKIEYKYIGDIIVSGLTKIGLNERLQEVLSEYIIEPEVDVQIVAYLSKVFYVVGDVNRPGKFYMKGDAITVRESLVQAGLPNHAAAMRRCRIITPDESGENNYVNVNVYKLLYEGDLRQNLVMKPGDVLYIPATIMAKAIRVISPVTNVISGTTETATKTAAVAAL
jgi:polysaccharide export outer membrane protein